MEINEIQRNKIILNGKKLRIGSVNKQVTFVDEYVTYTCWSIVNTIMTNGQSS